MLQRTPEAEAWPPDYLEIVRWRNARLLEWQDRPWLSIAAVKRYEKQPVEFISHWCTTYDPRKAGTGQPAKMPFYLFRRQEELVEFLYALVTAQENGLVEKCRDMGATWVCAAFSVWLWLFWPGASVGWGSRKADLVDKIGDPDSIFEKIRVIISNLPRELLPRDFFPETHMSYMRVVNPETGSTITGESGDNIGRGGRKLIYFKDESAHYERPEKIEAALTDNTNVQVDISSVNGLGNVFHTRRKAGVDWYPDQVLTKGRTAVFVMRWQEHPGKTREWYDNRRQKAEADGLLHLFAQEVDRNYSASVSGTVIPAAWISSAIDAHVKLRLDTTGLWVGGLDVADEGGDTNALALRKGIVLRHVEQWGDRDTGQTTQKAIAGCLMTQSHVSLQYDCVGVGAGVKAEANRLARDGQMPRGIELVPWNAGANPQDPRGRVVPGDDRSPRNEDFFKNLKSQAWWSLRRRFELTHRAVTDPSFTWDAEDLISLSSRDLGAILTKVEEELAQPIVVPGKPKLLVDKSPGASKSPNLADAIVEAYFPVKPFQAPQPEFGTYGAMAAR